ncbi:hypothetical protein AB0I77_37270 [Streptomyces sp. NPDC050619]|uniref:hypothetical protein n=1 Tax=Streptomyces sp. NPDC050619 TaxID=3157214 RepID=UPI0034245299
MDEHQRRALAGHPEGAAVTMHDAVLQLEFRIAHRPQPYRARGASSRGVDHVLASRSRGPRLCGRKPFTPA